MSSPKLIMQLVIGFSIINILVCGATQDHKLAQVMLYNRLMCLESRLELEVRSKICKVRYC